jgi:gliding motility-associated-like protein
MLRSTICGHHRDTRLVIIACLIFTCDLLKAQIIISDPTKLSTNSAVISIACNFINYSQQADFQKAKIVLTGKDQELLTSGAKTTFDELVVNGGGDKKFSGSWDILSRMQFKAGWVNLQPSSRLVFHGTESNQPVADNTSYVKGMFFSKGTGKRIFPIGNNDGYFPIVAMRVKEDVTIGSEVINGTAALVSDNPQLAVSFDDHYWKFDAELSFTGSAVALSLNGVALMNFVPVVSGGAGGMIRNIERQSMDSEYVYSADLVLAVDKILSFAEIKQVKVIIRNLITPNRDGSNDGLYIESIEDYPANKVSLIDRYGVVVREWTNYQNDQTGFDFSTLLPGNYVCTLEYHHTVLRKIKTSQMITVLH